MFGRAIEKNKGVPIFWDTVYRPAYVGRTDSNNNNNNNGV